MKPWQMVVLGAVLLAGSVVFAAARTPLTEPARPIGTPAPIAPAPTRTAIPTSTVHVLELLSVSGNILERYASVRGKVKNVGEQGLGDVIVIVIWHDANGKDITLDWNFIDYQPILPGQVSPFQVTATMNPAMKGFSIAFMEYKGETIPFHDTARY